MATFKDLTGHRFGRLTVIERAANSGKRTMWKCLCDCGKTVIAGSSNLIRGTTKSCGCLWFDVVPENNREINFRHGQSKTKIYRVWANMRYRCRNPKCKSYPNYGGRGIGICDEWDQFETFFGWAISNGYQEGLSIDRINNDGNYEPSNCRWVGSKEQINNRRANHTLTYNGDTHTISEWSEITGINWTTIKARLDMGWSIEKTLTQKTNRK